MKNVILLSAVIIFFGTSCKKDVPVLPQDPVQDAVALSENNSVNAIPINFSESFTMLSSTWNNCSGEFIDFSGIGHVQVRGVITDNKITYVLHYNLSNVKGYGRTSGTEYVTTSTFNYSNSVNYNTQYVYQQRATSNFIAKGKDSDFTVENNWHLTVNANGLTTFFFSTGGDVITCR
jgi:hypothetical protein